MQDAINTIEEQGCTNFRMRSLTRLVSRRYDAHIAAASLKTTQYSLLTTVIDRGPLRPTDLASALNVDASTLTRNLKPMLRAGWLVQGEGSDARSRLIVIARAGREKHAEAQRGWHAAQREINATLGVERVVALHTLIEESIELLRKAGATDEQESNEE